MFYLEALYDLLWARKFYFNSEIGQHYLKKEDRLEGPLQSHLLTKLYPGSKIRRQYLERGIEF